MSFTSKFSNHMTMISNFFIVITNEFFTNPASVARLELFFFFLTYDEIFVQVFFRYFFTILILFKNCFNKFISSIFTSKNNYWLGKFIINTNKQHYNERDLQICLSNNFLIFQHSSNCT